MNRREIEDETGTSYPSPDWAKIAAWCFGSWALLVPIAAGIIASGQDRIYTKLEENLRYQIKKDAEQDSQLAVLNANQQTVLQWKQRLENAGIIR